MPEFWHPTGGRAAHQQDQPEHLPKDQIQLRQRHTGIMPDRRSPLVSDPGPTSGTPQAAESPLMTTYPQRATRNECICIVR